MCISANSRVLWDDNHAILFWQIIHICQSIFGQKNCAICFWTCDVFISNSTLKLLYHNDVVKARNGHYEPIIFYNASWEIDQNILPQTKHTNQSKKCPLNNEVKNDLYLCMELMIICTHKKNEMKYHVKMWLTNLNISIGNLCTMND